MINIKNIKYIDSLNLTGGSNSKYHPYPYLYEGGKWGMGRDPINNVIKNYFKNREFIEGDMWHEQNIKETRILFDSDRNFKTYRFNWNSKKNGETICYIVSYNNRPLIVLLIKLKMIYENKPDHETWRVKDGCSYQRWTKYNRDYRAPYVDDLDHYSSLSPEIISALNTYENYIVDKLTKIHCNRRISDNLLDNDQYYNHNYNRRKGGYSDYDNRYNSDYESNYRHDYYSNNMHGGALGEFRKDINREIL